ncbi:hypothetical protein L6164_001789 [Bauhinia variegata]|uniref:Uncharacterized protein n=1 Tax=Bauhinia variegata TaxID=167791 RepID=A0ACB9QAQ6_BAUVA|nr:hypothetical protein L6164_001789 [Bauhinia variegata]
MLAQRGLMSWRRVGKSLLALLGHGLLFSFTILLVLKVDHVVHHSWWIIFSPLWFFHAAVARSRFSLPAPSMPHDRNWAPCHAVIATPLLVAFELLLCIHLGSSYVVNLKIVFLPLLAFEVAILVDNIRMCRALMPGDDETMTDDAIWETLPHFWVSISMVFLIAATLFTLLKICGDVAALGWWDLFINYGIAECFAFLVCTKWYNPTIHGNCNITDPCTSSSFSSSFNIRYLDWDRGFVVSSDDDRPQIGLCNLQDIGGHIMKIPFIAFQILLFMRLEGTPASARDIPLWVVFSPLLLLQGASKARECFGFYHHGSRLLGWWSIDQGSREERARLYCAGNSGYNTFSPDTVKKMPKADLVDEIWRLQAALGEQTEVTKSSQEEYERLQNEKILCRVCFEEQINVVLLPCRHHILCSSCADKCKRCPICRVTIEEQMPIHDV